MSDDSENRDRQHHEEPENHERWLVSYADFITLLFAFFVVMYATSTNNQEKQKSFQDSVRMNLKLVGSGGGDGAGGGGDGNVGGVATGDTLIQLDGFPARGGPGETKEYLNRTLESKLDKDDKDKVQNLRHDAIGVKIELASSQFFLPGGIKLKRNSLKALDTIANILKESDRKIVIEGHTDNTAVAADAPFESNWELASLRATSIVRYLINYHQIDPARLSAISYGDTRPLESNNSPEGRTRNRRIEIYLILDEKLQL